MWTTENRGRYDRDKLRYPSDLTDAEWQVIGPLIPPAKRGGGKRTVNMREVVNGARAHEVAALAARNLFYARLPEVKGTAGAAGLMSDEILVGEPGYEWTLNHVMEVENVMELFRIQHETVDAAVKEVA